MDIMVNYEVCNVFNDADGNEYSTNDWSEEEVIIEVDKYNVDQIIDKIFEYAYTVADNLVLFERRYDLLTEYDEDEDVIEHLSLTEIIIYNIRYEQLENENINGYVEKQIRRTYERG